MEVVLLVFDLHFISLVFRARNKLEKRGFCLIKLYKDLRKE